MKKIILSLSFCIPFLAVAQIPLGYYNTAIGSGSTLRVALRNIIRPHTELTYTPGLWNAYYTTDVKPSGKLWDMYSDIPGGTPAYQYTLGTDQCSGSSPSAEGGCYNREHCWPQSKFSRLPPMVSDLFEVIPTDYYVNNQRGDLPYGIVGGSVSLTFTNGSKLGPNTYTGAPSGNCYEPLDSFKGDIARTYFYMATCYYGADSSNFISWEMATGISFKPWAIQMLLEWHHNDPVSAKEINRNNKAYALQNNRNPFIDHPEFADCIWGTTTCVNAIGEVTPTDQYIYINANPANSTLSINWQNGVDNEVGSIAVLNINGQALFTTSTLNSTSNEASLNTASWAHGLYIVRINCTYGTEVRKVVIE